MPKRNKRKRWTQSELNIIKEYVILHKEDLIDNFYQNIIISQKKYPKYPKFYTNLSKKLKRSSSQCKSKFQKMEKEIYLQYLGMNENEYNLFNWIRQRKKENQKKNIQNHQTKIKIEPRQLRNKKNEKYFFENKQKKKKVKVQVEDNEQLIQFEQIQLSVARQYVNKKIKFSKLEKSNTFDNLLTKAELDLLDKEAHALLLKYSSKYHASQNYRNDNSRRLQGTPDRTDSMQNQKLSESLQW